MHRRSFLKLLASATCAVAAGMSFLPTEIRPQEKWRGNFKFITDPFPARYKFENGQYVQIPSGWGTGECPNPDWIDAPLEQFLLHGVFIEELPT